MDIFFAKLHFFRFFNFEWFSRRSRVVQIGWNFFLSFGKEISPALFKGLTFEKNDSHNINFLPKSIIQNEFLHFSRNIQCICVINTMAKQYFDDPAEQYEVEEIRGKRVRKCGRVSYIEEISSQNGKSTMDAQSPDYSYFRLNISSNGSTTPKRKCHGFHSARWNAAN